MHPCTYVTKKKGWQKKKGRRKKGRSKSLHIGKDLYRSRPPSNLRLRTKTTEIFVFSKICKHRIDVSWYTKYISCRKWGKDRVTLYSSGYLPSDSFFYDPFWPLPTQYRPDGDPGHGLAIYSPSPPRSLQTPPIVPREMYPKLKTGKYGPVSTTRPVTRSRFYNFGRPFYTTESRVVEKSDVFN